MVFLIHIGDKKKIAHLQVIFLTHTSDIAHLRACMWFFLIHIGDEKKNCSFASLQVIFLTHTNDITHLQASMWFFLIHICGKKKSIIKNINHKKKNVKH